MRASEIFAALGAPAGRADPYPLYARLHELGQAAVLRPGEISVHGYDAINRVLRDPRFRVPDAAPWESSVPAWREQPVFVQGADWLLNLNAPGRARIRSLIARAFTARRVAALEPTVTKMADELLDAMAERGSGGAPVEFMQDFARLLPVMVICELIGIPEADRESFRPIARELAEVFELNDPARLPVINAAAVDLLAYCTGLAANRRAHPRDDLITDLLGVSAAQDGRRIAGELLHNLTLLLVAGFETTTNLLGNGLHIVLTDPRAAGAVRDGQVSAADFVGEVLRFDSPVQVTNRIGADATIGGIAVRAGDSVVTVLGAGNRDPRKFAQPDRFDPRRRESTPLSFAGGAHFCVGAALARLAGNVAFTRLLTRFPQVAAAGEPARRASVLLRGFETLPVALGPAASRLGGTGERSLRRAG